MNIHPDFKPLGRFKLPKRRLAWHLVNWFIQFDQKRAKWQDGIRRREHQVISFDGEPFKVLEIIPEGVADFAPALMYFHGGAFFLDAGAVHLHNAQKYARGAGCRVFFPYYRLALRYPYPKGLSDCYRAMYWLVDKAERLGVDAERIAVGGDSAGGALAALVAQISIARNRPRLAGQMLIYPVIDHQCRSRSAREFHDTPVWNSGSNRRMWDFYLRSVGRFKQPHYMSPAQCEDLRDQPPAYVEIAECDPLHDEGAAYAEALAAADVAAELNDVAGAVHGYDAVEHSDIVKTEMARRIKALRGFLS